MTAPEFSAWPKTPRLNREVRVTEKIDGTNAAVIILPVADEETVGPIGDISSFDAGWLNLVEVEGTWVKIAAQSRTRIITPGKTSDNFGFAAWVQENATGLAHTLGFGYHYGEWWGKGIQRGYGLGYKRFSLFDVKRHEDNLLDQGGNPMVPGLSVVPTLYLGDFNLLNTGDILDELRTHGSVAKPGFPNPEGIVLFHSAARQAYKVLLENDHQPKGQAG